VQVDPIKPTLKAPGIKLLKLKYDKPLSNVAFKFTLRLYIEVTVVPESSTVYMGQASISGQVTVGWCRLNR
jgi:hypothetical protein